MRFDAIEVLGKIFPVFPLVDGYISVTSTDGAGSDGIFPNIAVVKCVSAGDIIITFNDNETTTTVTLASDDVYGIHNCDQIEISSGTYHLVPIR